MTVTYVNYPTHSPSHHFAIKNDYTATCMKEKKISPWGRNSFSFKKYLFTHCSLSTQQTSNPSPPLYINALSQNGKDFIFLSLHAHVCLFDVNSSAAVDHFFFFFPPLIHYITRFNWSATMSSRWIFQPFFTQIYFLFFMLLQIQKFKQLSEHTWQSIACCCSFIAIVR